MNIAIIVLVVALQYTPLEFPPVASPTPIPTATPGVMPTTELPTDNLITYLATAESNLRRLPYDIRTENTSAGFLPEESGSSLFSYVKWIVAPATTNELFGVFGAVVGRMTPILLLLFVQAAFYLFAFVATLIIRFVTWIITLLLKFIPFLG